MSPSPSSGPSPPSPSAAWDAALSLVLLKCSPAREDAREWLTHWHDDSQWCHFMSLVITILHVPCSCIHWRTFSYAANGSEVTLGQEDPTNKTAPKAREEAIHTHTQTHRHRHTSDISAHRRDGFSDWQVNSGSEEQFHSQTHPHHEAMLTHPSACSYSSCSLSWVVGHSHYCYLQAESHWQSSHSLSRKTWARSVFGLVKYM